MASTPRMPAAERRLQLLAQAQRVFGDKGFHAASMNDLAKAAGVTKPVLYQHFDSKRELYRELLDHVGAQIEDAVAKANADAAGPHEQVQGGLGAYFRFVADHPDAFRVLFGGGTRRDPDFSDQAAAIEARIARSIAPLIQIDGISTEHQTLLAYALVGLSEGASRYWLRELSDTGPDVIAEQLAQFAWAGLRGVGSTPD